MRLPTLLRSFCCFSPLLVLLQAGAQAPSVQPDDALALAKSYVGLPLFLRCLCTDSKQSYNAHGDLVQPSPKRTDWTLAGFDLQSVSRNADGTLELTGVRVAIRYNPGSKLFDRHPLPYRTIRITLPAPPSEDAHTALTNLFADGIDYRLQQQVSPEWQRYFAPTAPWKGADALAGVTIYTLSKTDPLLLPPKPLHHSAWDMTEEAQQDHVTGTIRLQLVIDPAGMPHRITLLQPVGYGLDSLAAEALKKWRFAPATKDGQPVAAQAIIEQQIVLPASR